MIVYENEGHARRMARAYPHFAFKVAEWRKDPHCRNPDCRKKMHLMPLKDNKNAWKDQVTLDHIIAQGLGGSDEPENWQILCGKCNNRKSRGESDACNKMIRIDERQFVALKKKAELLDALRKEGVKLWDGWERAQLRLQTK